MYFRASLLILAAFGLQGCGQQSNSSNDSTSKGHQDISGFSPQQISTIEKIMENHILNHPELVEEAIKKAIEKREMAHGQLVSSKIQEYHAQLFDSKSPFAGNPNGTEQIVVFLDPYCGYCRRFEQTLYELVAKRPNLKVIYKLIPILGKQSEQAVHEQVASHLQGKFVEFQHALFASEAKNRKERLQIAQSIGVEEKKLREDLESPDVNRILKDSAALASILDIHGTPAVIVGGQMVPGFIPAEALEKLLDKTA